jgi:hypothetical protein
MQTRMRECVHDLLDNQNGVVEHVASEYLEAVLMVLILLTLIEGPGSRVFLFACVVEVVSAYWSLKASWGMQTAGCTITVVHH